MPDLAEKASPGIFGSGGIPAAADDAKRRRSGKVEVMLRARGASRLVAAAGMPPLHRWRFFATFIAFYGLAGA
ncbi:hypothetical protein OPIT5_13950 [Opitutaceae bacterium TAV5]|nr:hypothetical protein OPIT5_13950 [Opitutaceae bacterium TAV5]